MAIRVGIKALIVRDGQILLNRCRRGDKFTYYTLPGGGQRQYESVMQALEREIREETGLSIRPLHMAAMCEEITTDLKSRAQSPDYTHRLTLIFAAKPLDDVSAAPEHPDSEMQCSEWVALEQADELNLYPRPLRRHIKEALCANGALWLGTDFIENDG